MGIPGEDGPGVYTGTDFLHKANGGLNPEIGKKVRPILRVFEAGVAHSGAGRECHRVLDVSRQRIRVPFKTVGRSAFEAFRIGEPCDARCFPAKKHVQVRANHLLVFGPLPRVQRLPRD